MMQIECKLPDLGVQEEAHLGRTAPTRGTGCVCCRPKTRGRPLWEGTFRRHGVSEHQQRSEVVSRGDAGPVRGEHT